ncbi:uroporphyrinogen-III synthase [Striga asiatica]|uniref:Uroporphyrinogen-III synthase n=1 Tax=Striga asiatica TaxID=4170 RepID=A0A5A7Q2N1_STRAF|nr:uroporphyrinogen-III synthase [Striga asiatica]
MKRVGIAGFQLLSLLLDDCLTCCLSRPRACFPTGLGMSLENDSYTGWKQRGNSFAWRDGHFHCLLRRMDKPMPEVRGLNFRSLRNEDNHENFGSGSATSPKPMTKDRDVRSEPAALRVSQYVWHSPDESLNLNQFLQYNGPPPEKVEISLRIPASWQLQGRIHKRENE